MHASHQPRKRFGQNFLHDPGVIAAIVRSIDPRPGQRVVEIGPGLGAITRPLLERLGRLHVVEIDRDLAARLASECAGAGELVVHTADALRFDFAALAGAQPLRVVGNLPYNISTPLIFHLLANAGHVADLHFLLQKEVVDRMVAGPGSGDYGRLSVMVQRRCRVERVLSVGSGAFWPAPKVESAFVRLEPRPEKAPDPDFDRAFALLVAAAFSQRRKTLRNSLKHWLTGADWAGLDIDPGERPERLSIAQFEQLAAAAQAATAAEPQMA